jgi:hypothetical protein
MRDSLGAIAQLDDSSMDQPDLTAIYETFIRIGPPSVAWPLVTETLRSQVAPLMRDLSKDGIINWYCFLIHDRHPVFPPAATTPIATCTCVWDFVPALQRTGCRRDSPPIAS